MKVLKQYSRMTNTTQLCFVLVDQRVIVFQITEINTYILHSYFNFIVLYLLIMNLE
jgi:hypothetical protein